MIFEALVDFGLKEITTREVARERRAARRLLADTFGLKLVLAAAASIALLLAVHVLGAEPDERFACYLLGAASILRSYLLTIRHTLQGLERFGLDSTSVVIDRLLLLGLGSAALTGGFGLLGLAASFVFARMLSLFVACMLAASQVGRIRLAFDVTSWRALQLQALPFGAFAVVFYLYSYVDTVMLWALRSDAETGLYSAAYRLYEGLSSAPQVLHAVLIPRLASHFVRDRAAHARLSRTALSVSFVLAVPVCIGAVLLANPLVGVFFGAEYAAAGLPLQILGVGFVFVFPPLRPARGRTVGRCRLPTAANRGHRMSGEHHDESRPDPTLRHAWRGGRHGGGRSPERGSTRMGAPPSTLAHTCPRPLGVCAVERRRLLVRPVGRQSELQATIVGLDEPTTSTGSDPAGRSAPRDPSPRSAARSAGVYLRHGTPAFLELAAVVSQARWAPRLLCHSQNGAARCEACSTSPRAATLPSSSADRSGASCRCSISTK